jgi:hypothetical protein
VAAGAGRDLGGREAEHFPEQKYGWLVCRQVLQAGDERKPQALACGNHHHSPSIARGPDR